MKHNSSIVSKLLGASDAKEAHDYLLRLGNITVRLSEIDREPRHPDGGRETDVEHSFHLALSATELAASFFPELNAGLIAQFSLVHDLPEIYAGDVWTFNVTQEELAKKVQIEKKALKRLLKELPPHTALLLSRYEEQCEPEARFVRFVDKLLPFIINLMAGEANTFKEDYGIASVEDLKSGVSERAARLQATFPEFPFIHLVDELVSKTACEYFFRA